MFTHSSIASRIAISRNLTQIFYTRPSWARWIARGREGGRDVLQAQIVRELAFHIHRHPFCDEYRPHLCERFRRRQGRCENCDEQSGASLKGKKMDHVDIKVGGDEIIARNQG